MNRATTLLSVLTFTSQGGVGGHSHRRHGRQQRQNILLADLAITIEVVDLKHKVYLLVELRAIQTQQTC